MENYLTQKQVLEQTGLKYYQLEHLIKSGIVQVYRCGSGNPRKFPLAAIEIIQERLKKIADPSGH